MEFAELPGVIRRLVGRYSGLADDSVHAAEILTNVLGEIGSEEPGELRRAALQVEACVERVDRILHNLLIFVGELKGLTWAVELVERSRE